MAWSKVSSEHKKPLRWWLHKILCEYGWLVRNKDNSATYYHHLKMCIDLGFNLYGEKIEAKKRGVDFSDTNILLDELNKLIKTKS